MCIKATLYVHKVYSAGVVKLDTFQKILKAIASKEVNIKKLNSKALTTFILRGLFFKWKN